MSVPTKDEWQTAAEQALDDLRAIEEVVYPDGERFATWSSPAATMRMVAKLSAREAGRLELDEEDDLVCARCGGEPHWFSRTFIGCPGCDENPDAEETP